MALTFDSTTFTSIDAIPENLRNVEIYPKVTAMMDYIIRQYAAQWEDVKFKFAQQDQVSQDVITNTITEFGYNYIANVMATITNVEFNTLLEFLSLINLLKGSRPGMELVLKLLGFDSVIVEWWEQVPAHETFTFEIVVIMDSSRVPNAVDTLNRVKIFASAYVFPLIENIDFRYQIQAGSLNVVVGGFAKPHYVGSILGSI